MAPSRHCVAAWLRLLPSPSTTISDASVPAEHDRQRIDEKLEPPLTLTSIEPIQLFIVGLCTLTFTSESKHESATVVPYAQYCPAVSTIHPLPVSAATSTKPSFAQHGPVTILKHV